MADEKKKSPSVSVIIPAYNEEQYIAETIESILGQSFTDFELIIVDDGSTDSTYEIASSFIDPRVQVYKQKNAGPASARNKALQIAKGKYIALQDADDRSKPNRLKRQYDCFKKKKIIAVGTYADILDKDGEFIYERKKPILMPDNWAWDNSPVIHPSVMFKRRVLDKIGGYPDIPVSQDTFFLYKMSKHGKLVNLQESLYEYRIHPTSISRKNTELRITVQKLFDYYRETGELDTESIEKIKEIKSNQTVRGKQYQYYLLLAKKYLWNNYSPHKSRESLKKAIKLCENTFCFEPIFLFGVTWLGKTVVDYIYNSFKN